MPAPTHVPVRSRPAVHLALLTTALLGSSTALAGTLRVGATPVPAGELLEFVRPVLARQGVTLVIREFSDYVQPNLALGDGSLDANLFQHEPYLNAFQAGRPLNIVPVRRIYLPPLGLYSKRVSKVTDLNTGATIAIPNDPSNGARALLLLERAGLIRLKTGVGVRASVADIRSNVRRLKFRELEAAQLPRSLADVDAAIINTNYALEIGLNPERDAIYREGQGSLYANVLATTRDKVNNPDLKKLTAVLTSPEVRAWLLRKYGGSVIPAF
ncbi:MetQ/NlpA family ABC transporter substrate-binding protein [Deinococcus depolymerans]|uniref:Lipoprotein n=1 Tax=Deinococcus depolymerans TaxID=392408 RepID=A0ABP3LMJ7_9DEIO